MSPLRIHADYEELLGAYALDAVEGPEADVVELHLDGCPRCRDEVAHHRETAALLGHAGVTAPEGVWDRIASELREPPPALALVRADAADTPAAGPPPPPPDSGRSGIRRLRRRISARPFMALVGVAAMVIGVLGFELSNLQGQVSQLRTDESGKLQQLVNLALTTPGHETVAMRSAAGKQWATAVIAPNGQGYLVGAALRPLPASRTYQLWAYSASGPVSVGLLGTHPSQVSFHLSPASTRELAITVEPVGGVVTPTQPAVVLGTPVLH